jgi:aryl-alcohol dehydrogenase-like predicted oxidoreductase
MLEFIHNECVQMTCTSKIVFGTMRMSPERQKQKDWARLLLHAQDLGVVRIHCSDEYESFPFFIRVMEEVRRSSPQFDFRFTVKLAEPHFSEADFEPKRFLKRIDAYREALQADQLDCVQWMWRGHLDDEGGRLRGFHDATDRILDTVEHAKHQGLIKGFRCFPYTLEFAKQALDHPKIDGLAIYRNPLENEYDPFVARVSAIKKSILVIRPFKAGDAFLDLSASKLIRFSSSLPVVDGIVVSCSSKLHLEECVEAVAL